MGRTVINETENKQTVILNDSPEGIEGGYFDALMEWHDLGEAIPVIKVNLGKGTSGTAIQDNPARAITDMIPLTDTSKPLQLFAPDNYLYSIKLCTGDDSVLTTGYGLFPSSLEGTSWGTASPWASNSCGKIYYKENNKYALIDTSAGNGNIRIVFEKTINTEPVEDVFDGYIVVDEKVYHLISEA